MTRRSAARCRSAAPTEQLPAVAEIVAAAADWLKALPADAAREAVRPRVSRRGGPEPLGMLATEDALLSFSKEASVRPREGLNVCLDSDPAGRLLLKLPDRELSLPAYVEPALRSLLERPCRVSELDLPVDDALVLVRRLLREGVVTAAS